MHSSRTPNAFHGLQETEAARPNLQSTRTYSRCRVTSTLGAMKVPRAAGADLERLSKVQVRALADDLLSGEPDAVEAAVRFVCAETVNLWHGRGRAMMCRRMKHVGLSRGQQARLVTAILGRLANGNFSEQFRDQLRLAMHLDAEGTARLAKRALKSEKEHVRRLAAWVLSHDEALHDA